jgi:SAM-dependent methyltransferase
VELDYGQLMYRTYQAVLGGVTLHFWATSDLEDVCLPGCEVEACALPPPEPLDAALYAYDDTPGEKLRTGMVFGPVVALCAALDALLTAREQSPPEVTELTELTAPERSPQTGALGSTARRGGGSGLRLLELGAGVGLVGLWAAARGAQDGAHRIAQVVLTDRNSASLELMRRNAAFFAERATTAAPTTAAPTTAAPTTAAPTTAAPIVQVSALDWAGAHPSWLDGSFDLVAASEALNVPAAVPLFFATAAAALREGGRLVLAMQRRSAWRSGVLLDREVLPAAKAVGLALETPEVDLRQGADARDDARLGCEAQGATVILTFILRCRVQTG